MSVYQKALALPVTIFDLLEARDEALRLIADARTLTKKASDSLSRHGSFLMPHCALLPGSESDVRRELDASMWRRAFDLIGFKQLMDAQAVEEFEKSLSPNPPEFKEGTIRATFIDLRLGADNMFRRGVFNVFRYLSDDYRTNAREPFRIGRKVVMGFMVRASFRKGRCINYGRSADRLNDIDRVFMTLDKKHFQPRTLESAMNMAFEEGQIFESEYYKAKAFKNGNLHLEFKRADLLEKVNEEIAVFYQEGSIPDARKA